MPLILKIALALGNLSLKKSNSYFLCASIMMELPIRIPFPYRSLLILNESLCGFEILLNDCVMVSSVVCVVTEKFQSISKESIHGAGSFPCGKGDSSPYQNPTDK